MARGVGGVAPTGCLGGFVGAHLGAIGWWGRCVVGGLRGEEREGPLVRKARDMDKLIDGLAKGKALEKIMRGRVFVGRDMARGVGGVAPTGCIGCFVGAHLGAMGWRGTE